MKRILITGANSYIGTSFEKWLGKDSDKYIVDTIDMIGDDWRKKSFAGYDAILHVAGIVHKKKEHKIKDLYYKVNRDLTYEVANKAKKERIRHFVFLSSMSVYGLTEGTITINTNPIPNTDYGKSKLQGEMLINELYDNNFIVSCLRPPMVYGQACKGNFQSLVKLALKTPVFPNVRNKRSMIYIENLCEFIRVVIENEIAGVLFPQNNEYVCTTDMVKLISNKIIVINGFNRIISYLTRFSSTLSKMFGNLTYDKAMSNINANYNIVDFCESIKRSL